MRIFQSLQFKHLRTSDPERLPHGMLACAPAHVKMQDVAVVVWCSCTTTDVAVGTRSARPNAAASRSRRGHHYHNFFLLWRRYILGQ
jgi:hypothetical protein